MSSAKSLGIKMDWMNTRKQGSKTKVVPISCWSFTQLPTGSSASQSVEADRGRPARPGSCSELLHV